MPHTQTHAHAVVRTACAAPPAAGATSRASEQIAWHNHAQVIPRTKYLGMSGTRMHHPFLE